jgi:hypothetical protein
MAGICAAKAIEQLLCKRSALEMQLNNARMHIGIVKKSIFSAYRLFRHARSSQSGIHVLSKMDSRLRIAGMTTT